MQKTERKAATLQELQLQLHVQLQCMEHRNAALQDELKEAKLQQQTADAGLQAALEELQESCDLICALLLASLSANVMYTLLHACSLSSCTLAEMLRLVRNLQYFGTAVCMPASST